MSKSQDASARRENRSAAIPADVEMAPWLWLGLPLVAAVTLIVLAQATPAFYRDYMEPEIGVLELLHILEGLLGAILAGGLLARAAVRARRWLTAWVLAALVGCVYVAGEEASWGQHLFAWATPGNWQQLNDQGETNLHNVSSWFDQKPRALLEVMVIVGGIVLPLLKRGGRYLQAGRLAYLVPPLACLPAAAMAELVRVDEFGAWLAGSPSGLFYRGSEVQELFFYFFVILYLLALQRRVRNSAPPD